MNAHVLIDPEAELGDEGAVVGYWPVDDDGLVGRFHPNPDYRPADEYSPTDPLDALLRLAVLGDAELFQLQAVMVDTLMAVAMNGDGRPMMVPQPDGLCLMIATSVRHRAHIGSPDWREVDLYDLVGLLPDGVDVLFNPGGPAVVRLAGAFLRETVLDADGPVPAG
jgi:hypothetical protein